MEAKNAKSTVSNSKEGIERLPISDAQILIAN
jgi:hypothetical protein